MRFSTSVLAAAATLIASVSAACDAAALQGPDGNPTTAPVAGETLKMLSAYTITWQPTTPGPIDIELLAGATAETLSVVATVASGIANNGSYTWNVPGSSSGLASTTTSGYGFRLVDQTTCTFQFSPNFGIEDPSATTQTVTLVSATTSTNVTAAVTGATGTASVTSPVVSPTKSMSVPASLKSTATRSSATTSATVASEGLAAPTGVVGWNAGMMMAAGVVGAMML